MESLQVERNVREPSKCLLISVFTTHLEVVFLKELYVRSILGQEEALTKYDVTRKRGLNSEKYIDVTVVKHETNEHSFPLVQPENF